ncbi:MAG: hypothetical protein DRP90_03000 [Planctomycetota bacterium]|nr:MAG: hypothetical protein DRP90_03000 [Planctomycetota bacterium]
MESIKDFYEKLGSLLGEHVVNALAAIVVLILGWGIARLIAGLVYRFMGKAELDRKLSGLVGEPGEEKKADFARWISRTVFWFLMLFVFVAFFEFLKLEAVTGPINKFLDGIFAYLPKILAAVVLTFIAFLCATLGRKLTEGVVRASDLGKKLGEKTGEEKLKDIPLSRTMGDAVYWLVLLLFLPAILGALELEGLLSPVRSMVDKVLLFLPNLFGAAVILLVGWLIAKVVRHVVEHVTAAAGADGLGEKLGLAGSGEKRTISGLLGLTAFLLVLFPVLIGALDALSLESITKPASEVLQSVLKVIPALFAGVIILGIAWFVARALGSLLTEFLARAGFDTLMVNLKLTRSELPESRRPSAVAGKLLMLAVVLIAAVEACNVIGFTQLAGLLHEFLLFAGHVLLGLVIFLLGLYLADIAARLVRDSGSSNAPLLSTAARVAVIVLASAVALRQMGLANEIINIAFGLLLGSVAVAVAIAFGIGGRDIAARKLEKWVEKVEKKEGED